MPNYFFTDANGVKRGPVNDQQLQALVAQGVITPSTLLETEGGHKGTAGQIPGLRFNTAPPPSFAQPAQTTSYSQSTPSYSQASESVGGSIVSWLTDFAFRDLRLPIVNLWVCRIIYVICCIAAIIWGVVMTIMCIYFGFAEGVPFLIIIYVPLLLLSALLFIFAVRLACEWYIIVFDWIIETTKAARMYRKNNKGD